MPPSWPYLRGAWMLNEWVGKCHDSIVYTVRDRAKSVMSKWLFTKAIYFKECFQNSEQRNGDTSFKTSSIVAYCQHPAIHISVDWPHYADRVSSASESRTGGRGNRGLNPQLVAVEGVWIPQLVAVEGVWIPQLVAVEGVRFHLLVAVKGIIKCDRLR